MSSNVETYEKLLSERWIRKGALERVLLSWGRRVGMSKDFWTFQNNIEYFEAESKKKNRLVGEGEGSARKRLFVSVFEPKEEAE